MKPYEIGRDETGLTARERDVLAVVTDDPNLSYAQIADRLGLTKARVGQLVQQLRAKAALPNS